MEEINEFITDFYNNIVEHFETTNINKIKPTDFKKALETNSKELLTLFKDKIKSTPKKIRNINPALKFINQHKDTISKDKKQQYGFNDLTGYTKLKKIMTYLIKTNIIDINDEDYNLSEHLEEYSTFEVPEEEEEKKVENNENSDTNNTAEEPQKKDKKKKKEKTKEKGKKKNKKEVQEEPKEEIPKSDSDSDSD
jgi:hypothetical protein